MAKLPPIDNLAVAIKGHDEEHEVRSYLGMSQIGSPCDRYLYMYRHKMFKQILTAQQRRIFARGDMEEQRVYDDLLKIPGIELRNLQTEMTDFGGEYRGHCDGSVLGLPTCRKTEHVLEIKTMNAKSYTDWRKRGMKKSKPGYWAQGHTYMGQLGLSRIIWIVTNKDNEDRHYERAHFDKDTYEFYQARAKRIIEATEIPDRITQNPSYFECKWCAARHECWKS